MIRILAISLLLTFNFHFLYSQNVKKEKVYLLFNDYSDNCSNNNIKDKLKWFKKEGLQFNLCDKEVFINKTGMRKDTLCIWHLNDYKTTKESELKSLEKKWRKKNERKLKEKYILYKQLDRNAVFDINIIEKINESQIVIYEVEFRNEGVVK